MAKTIELRDKNPTIWVVLFTYMLDGQVEEQIWCYQAEADALEKRDQVVRHYDEKMKGVPLIGIRVYGLDVRAPKGAPKEVTLH